ncbi:MAG: AraC family transcriptional regulator [Candidatus Firestonebacteria bacterium]
MIHIYKFEIDRLKKILFSMNIELQHIHLAEKKDKWTSGIAVHKDNVYEFCFVVDGKGEYYLEGKKFNMEPGDLFVVKPYEEHYEVCDLSDPFELVFITIRISKENKMHTLDEIFKFPTKIHIIPEREIGDIFQNILDEAVVKKTGYTLKIKSYLINLLIEIYRFLHVRNEIFSSTIMLNKNLQKNIVMEMCKYIKKNYKKQFSDIELSNKFHLSPQHISSLFRKEIGSSPIQYLTKIKIEIAKNLLKNFKKKISSIASEVGYNDPYYFHRIFKKNTGVTPGKYREKLISVSGHNSNNS